MAIILLRASACVYIFILGGSTIFYLFAPHTMEPVLLHNAITQSVEPQLCSG
eukprot:m.225049 g.225049  ORF g.225049 m.225049 type:complete len:52 (+) comp17038_c0_seq4:1148-1303(+)